MNAGATDSKELIRATALNPGQERDFYLDNHPLNQRPVEILTRSIKSTYLIINEAVRFKRPGHCFAADFRMGKSTALAMIHKVLLMEMNSIAAHIITAKQHDLVTERTFWGDFLISLGLHTVGTAQDRQDRVRKALLAACIEADTRHFVLFIDEGQNWGRHEFTWLRDLSNQLSDQDRYTLTTIIWGDLRLLNLSAAFRTTRKDLWARFLVRPDYFSGIKDLEDLTYYMSEFDSPQRCEYPVGSGISYTEFFLPHAFSSGWRLAAEAPTLWDAFLRAAREVNRDFNEIGMQWITESVVQFLSEKTLTDDPSFEATTTDWDNAISRACFVDSLV